MIKRLLILLTFGVVMLAIFNITVWLHVLRPANSGPAFAAPTSVPATPLPAATATAMPSIPRSTVTPAPPLPTPTATAIPSSPSSTVTPAPPTPAQTELTTVEQVNQAIADGQHGLHFRIVFTQQQIGDEIKAYLQDNPNASFSDISVQLQPGVAIISGKAHVMSFNVGFKASTTIVVTAGRPRLKVVQLEVAGALLPGAIKDVIGQMIEQQADLPILADLPVVIEQVVIEAGQAVVIGSIP